MKVIVDFTNYPDLYNSLQKHANETIRDLPHAILSLLIDKDEIAHEHVAVLLSYGEQKIPAIKAWRGISNKGLKEAKEDIDNVPLIVYRGTREECVNKLKEFNECKDAKTEIRPVKPPLYSP